MLSFSSVRRPPEVCLGLCGQAGHRAAFGRSSALLFEQAQDRSEWFKKALLLDGSGAVPGQDDAVPLMATAHGCRSKEPRRHRTSGKDGDAGFDAGPHVEFLAAIWVPSRSQWLAP